ncbi:hypothetical protein EDD18DRAFT_1103665 [Armillaria luteobubalina]|uniref:Uncharacterized protein n=1 Tax=Armillaria luteobubalina TaxID=153913 RepID=A0AA39QB38_9AGAR|nr:hypothetical protein EDD18DRAFT_1103665 [Armillaria luteobubalina]
MTEQINANKDRLLPQALAILTYGVQLLPVSPIRNDQHYVDGIKQQSIFTGHRIILLMVPSLVIGLEHNGGPEEIPSAYFDVIGSVKEFRTTGNRDFWDAGTPIQHSPAISHSSGIRVMFPTIAHPVIHMHLPPSRSPDAQGAPETTIFYLNFRLSWHDDYPAVVDLSMSVPFSIRRSRLQEQDVALQTVRGLHWKPLGRPVWKQRAHRRKIIIVVGLEE